MGRKRSIAGVVVVALSTAACSTFTGSRTTAIVGAGTLAAGGGLFVASRTVDSADTSSKLQWAALGTAGLGVLLVLAGVAGMIALPTEEEAAVQLANLLVSKAHQGNCTTVRDRAHEVEEYDTGVYDRVLMTDDAVKHCLQQ